MCAIFDDECLKCMCVTQLCHSVQLSIFDDECLISNKLMNNSSVQESSIQSHCWNVYVEQLLLKAIMVTIF